jgi:hypothetical protein
MLNRWGHGAGGHLAMLLVVGIVGASSSVLAGDEKDMARLLYQQRCQSCHGAEGHGDGMMATALKPPPASFSDPRWQASIDDDAIKAIILQGGLAVGRSAAMPPHADLARRPGILKHLVALVRSFGAGGPPLLELKGRSDLQVRVVGGATKTPAGFSLTQGATTWPFVVDSGVREPSDPTAPEGVLYARARTWMNSTGGAEAKRSLNASLALTGEQRQLTVSATVEGTAEGTCWIYVVGGEPSGGLVPWFEATGCGSTAHPPFTLSVEPAPPVADLPAPVRKR